jgi:hypothetical protein
LAGAPSKRRCMRVIKREPRQRGARRSVNYYGVGYEQTRGIEGKPGVVTRATTWVWQPRNRPERLELAYQREYYSGLGAWEYLRGGWRKEEKTRWASHLPIGYNWLRIFFYWLSLGPCNKYSGPRYHTVAPCSP